MIPIVERSEERVEIAIDSGDVARATLYLGGKPVVSARAISAEGEWELGTEAVVAVLETMVRAIRATSPVPLRPTIHVREEIV